MAVETAGTSTGTTETVSAEHVAADAGDVGAFLQHSRDRRAGKPPAAVERAKAAPAAEGAAAVTTRAAVVPGKDGAVAPGPSAKDREADERLTTRIREAVDTSTADLRRQNRELEEQLGAIRRGTTSTTEKAGTGAGEAAARKTVKDYQAMSGAPKLDDKDATGAYLYETSGEHAVALAEFVREQREDEKAQTSRKSTEGVERLRHDAARVTTFAGRIEAYKTANPDLLVDNGKGEKTAVPLSPDLAAMHGYAQLATINADRQSKGLAPIPATVDHAIAEELYDSEIPMECAVYLSTHPAELATLRQAQTPAQLTRAVGALEERVRKALPAAANGTAATTVAAVPSRKDAATSRREAEEAVDRSVSSTRPLKENLGRGGGADADPEETAVATNNFGLFQETQRARRLEKLGARR